MRVHVWRDAFALVLSVLALATTRAQAAEPTVLALTGGRVIDGFGGTPLEQAVVLVRGNRIEKVGPANVIAIPAGARIIDVSGMTVLPGLWESHGHLMHIGEGDPDSFPANYAARAQEIMGAVARTTLLSGITTFRDTGGPLEDQLALRADIEAGRAIGPRLFLAGPILRQRNLDPRASKSAKEDPDLIGSARQAREQTRRLIDRGVNQVKVYGFWDVDILREVTATAHAANIGVDADVRHIVAYRTAVEAGVDRLHHVFTADALSDYSDDDLRMLVRGAKPTGTGPMANILRGPYIVPTLEMRQSYARALRYPGLLDQPRFKSQFPPDIYQHLRSTWTNPASIPWGIGAAQRVETAKRKLQKFIAFGGREQLIAGTDAGSPLNVHPPLLREIRNLHEAGLTAMEAIQAATMRPAQMQGVLEDLGTITAGKLADIVVVDGDPLQDISVIEHRIVLIVKDGKLHQPEPQTVAIE
ncbi:MAG: amidohydrolase family protein [Pseudomonadota bacterium]|nr:amidohydrolase family protein [Pseudomonadota bacterium]